MTFFMRCRAGPNFPGIDGGRIFISSAASARAAFRIIFARFAEYRPTSTEIVLCHSLMWLVVRSTTLTSPSKGIRRVPGGTLPVVVNSLR
jgi:hypothetical protein